MEIAALVYLYRQLECLCLYHDFSRIAWLAEVTFTHIKDEEQPYIKGGETAGK